MENENKEELTPKVDAPEVETPETTEKTPEQSETDKTDYREKFSNSSRENQVILGKNKDLESRIDNLTNIKDPTEEDLKKEFSNWEFMSDGERDLAKANVKTQQLNLRTQNMLLDQQDKAKAKEVLDNVYTTHPELVAKKDEFEAYMRKPSHKGASPEILAKAFKSDFAEELADNKKPEAKGDKGTALETGSGGANAPATPSISDKDIEAIRKTNPKKYTELIKKGII